MRVDCPRCGAQIEIQVSSLRPQFRWGTSELPAISGICERIKHGDSRILPDGTFNCLDLERAVEVTALGRPSFR